MGKLIPLLLSLLLLCSCAAPNKPTATDAQQNEKLSVLANKIQELEKLKASKEYVESPEFANSLKSKIATESYTKSEVDKKVGEAVVKAINDLKDNQSWVKQQPTSYNPYTYQQPTYSTGTVTYVTVPSPIPAVYSNGSISYTLRLTNNGSSVQYVKPIVVLTPIVGTNIINITRLRVVMSNSQCTLVGTGWSNNSSYPNTGVLYDGQNSIFSVSPPLGSSYNSAINITPLGACGGYSGFSVNSGQSVDVQIQITNIEATSGFQWSINNQINSTAY